MKVILRTPFREDEMNVPFKCGVEYIGHCHYDIGEGIVKYYVKDENSKDYYFTMRQFEKHFFSKLDY